MRWLTLVLALLLPGIAAAHVGNPDVYYEGQAGPYQLFVTIRPPLVVPGVAEVEVRDPSGAIQSLDIVPVPLSAFGERNASGKLAPVPDHLRPSKEDSHFFTGSVWIMAAGSWQVRIQAHGTSGDAVTSVPLPSVAQTVKRMERPLAVGLFVLMLLLASGIVLIAGGATREAKLDTGSAPTGLDQARARRAMVVSSVVVVAILALGWLWWRSSETTYRRNVFTPLAMQASLDGRGILHLTLEDTTVQPTGARLQRAFFMRSVDDLVPDHNHLMHLYAIREPGLDVVYHLHPSVTSAGRFELPLPSMDAGRYRLYADIVHENGFPETLTSQLDVPDRLPARELTGDDASGSANPWQSASLDRSEFALPDGYTMQWERSSEPLRARQLKPFRFVLLDRQHKPAADAQLYMGMEGHAAFLKTDGSAFAHIHPSGSVAMASLMMAQGGEAAAAPSAMQGHDMSSMSGMAMDHSNPAASPNTVVFPYGFPSSGRYRIFVQMKHGSTVETGIFDTAVQ